MFIPLTRSAASPALDELMAAIEALYATFARYPERAHVHGCPCCVDAADYRLLCGQELREMHSHCFDRYAFKAMTTWGDEDDFRHFLPRMLELELSGDGLEAGIEGLIDKLDYGAWRTWPADEQGAIEALFLAWGKVLLTAAPAYHSMTEFLFNYLSITRELGPFLECFDRASETSLTALRHLADAATLYFGPHRTDDVFEVWITRPAVEERLIAAALVPDNQRYFDDFARGADALQARRTGQGVVNAYAAHVREAGA